MQKKQLINIINNSYDTQTKKYSIQHSLQQPYSSDRTVSGHTNFISIMQIMMYKFLIVLVKEINNDSPAGTLVSLDYECTLLNTCYT